MVLGILACAFSFGFNECGIQLKLFMNYKEAVLCLNIIYRGRGCFQSCILCIYCTFHSKNISYTTETKSVMCLYTTIIAVSLSYRI